MGIPPTIEVANLGMADSLILMVLALVVFGPRRLPQIGRQIGKLMYEFRKASNDFKFQMEEELRSAEEADRRKKEEERLRAQALTTPAQATTPPAEPPALAASAPSETPSPYPGESLYPSLTTPSPEPPSEEPYPRIQPPSTGEQVPADRPWNLEEKLAELSSPANGEHSAGETSAPEAKVTGAPESVSGEPGPQEPRPQIEDVTPPTEQAARHG